MGLSHFVIGQVADFLVPEKLLFLAPTILDYDFTDESIFRVLADEFGIELHHATNEIEAATTEAHQADLLRLPHPSGILVMRQTTFSDLAQPVEYVVLATQRMKTLRAELSEALTEGFRPLAITGHGSETIGILQREVDARPAQ